MKAFGQVFVSLMVLWLRASVSTADYGLQEILQFNVGTELGQCRAVPVDLGDEEGIFLAYCQDAEVDPYVEMSFFLKHRMKISVYTHSGREVWTKELGGGVIPGIWFVPFFPFDLDGDGLHELVRGIAEGNGEVLDRTGRVIGNIGGSVAMVSKVMDRPGEQILCYYPDGTSRIWADKNAKDSETAKWRCEHPFYKANQRLTATGYNIVNLGGL